MAKRRTQTVADYAAIALCPALITLLIASLVYFLVLCVYRGEYSARIGYIWFMFIMGTVGIARLSIEESRKYAMGYGAVLGLATFFVLGRFMTVQGPLAALTPIINGVLIAMVWVLADRITFDCTVIDEDEDASGSGLLDGLTTTRGEVEGDADASRAAKRKRGRQPGRTVLWLTAAALPFFGVGQLLVPQSGSAMVAMGVYLFAALSLLVATSFLGVRRYLRQRGVDMPANVSVAWLAGGVAMTAAMLLACFLIPQPGKMLASVELPQSMESPDWLKPSKYGWGGESAKPGEGESQAAGTDPKSDEQKAANQASDKGGSNSESKKSSGEAGGKKQGDEGEGGEQKGGKKKKPGDEKGGNEPKGEKGEKAEQGKEQSGQGDKKNGDQSQQGEKEKSEQQGDGGEQSKDAEQQDSSSKPEQGESQSSGKPESAKPPESPSLADSLPSLGNIFKALIYIVLIGFLVVFAYLQREEIAKLWAALLAWFRGERLPEDSEPARDEFNVAAKPQMPFSAFRNPLVEKGDPREAVIVTYQAAEAWWRERGQPRKPDETPYEFVSRLKLRNMSDQEAMAKLTDSYNRIVYGNASVTAPDLAAAAAVWKSFATQRTL